MGLGEKMTDLQITLEADFICQLRSLIKDPGEIQSISAQRLVLGIIREYFVGFKYPIWHSEIKFSIIH